MRGVYHLKTHPLRTHEYMIKYFVCCSSTGEIEDGARIRSYESSDYDWESSACVDPNVARKESQ